MELSPKARTALTVALATLTALGASLGPIIGVDNPAVLVIGVIVAVLSAVAAALNVVPPQVGGTQQGLASPSITEPPNADIDHRAVDGPPLRRA